MPCLEGAQIWPECNKGITQLHSHNYYYCIIVVVVVVVVFSSALGPSVFHALFCGVLFVISAPWYKWLYLLTYLLSLLANFTASEVTVSRRDKKYNYHYSLTHSSNPTVLWLRVDSRAAVCGPHACGWSNATDISRPPASVIFILTHRLPETWYICRSFLQSAIRWANKSFVDQRRYGKISTALILCILGGLSIVQVAHLHRSIKDGAPRKLKRWKNYYQLLLLLLHQRVNYYFFFSGICNICLSVCLSHDNFRKPWRISSNNIYCNYRHF